MIVSARKKKASSPLLALNRRFSQRELNLALVLLVLVVGGAGWYFVGGGHAATATDDEILANLETSRPAIPAITNISSTHRATSPGFAGYLALSGSAFSYVNGSFTLPKVTCNYAPSRLGLWVATTTGVNNANIQQAGVAIYCTKVGGTPVYKPFYQLYPQQRSPVFASTSMKAGDPINVTVNFQSGKYYFNVEDQAGHMERTLIYASGTCSSGCTRKGAMWLMEGSATANPVRTMLGWTSIPFSGSVAGSTSHYYPISHYSNIGINLAGLANASALSANGENFTITR